MSHQGISKGIPHVNIGIIGSMCVCISAYIRHGVHVGPQFVLQFFVVTSHHFVWPLVLSTLDFG